MTALEAAGIGQRYGGRTALFPLDLRLERGDRLAVLGANGAGKTTLLRVLATVTRPSSGSLSIFGVDALKDRAAARRRAGYLGHGLGLYPVLTAAENLRFFTALAGAPAAAATRARELVELPAAVDARPVRELSRGMQQRLALARSLLHDPDLWVVDEPDASLDATGGGLLARLMDGRTVVMATHDRDLAAALCARSLTLDAGRVASRRGPGAPGGPFDRLEVVG